MKRPVRVTILSDCSIIYPSMDWSFSLANHTTIFISHLIKHSIDPIDLVYTGQHSGVGWVSVNSLLMRGDYVNSGLRMHRSSTKDWLQRRRSVKPSNKWGLIRIVVGSAREGKITPPLTSLSSNQWLTKIPNERLPSKRRLPLDPGDPPSIRRPHQPTLIKTIKKTI